ncbi:hypothetical protein [Erythrobacter sp.]|uniref:hypothetical protein n=1 Tax=Erythrobacter sp. TaxID=1042 RepID=UPI001425BC70|nr:hypothetical protein [Erythrobacter sp.]QIQ85811.1 MAG: hypothetical protein G9473_03245 [Erythrobacter sp.]
MTRLGLALLPLAALALPAAAQQDGKESLGVYSNWAAFRDESAARCYAIARPRGSNRAAAFASIATWPKRGIRGQLHIRLARPAAKGSAPSLRVGSRRFDLVARGRDAWAKDAAADAAIIAALRSATILRVTARAAGGGRFTSRYDLDGVATAMDAATVGCANLR